MIFGLADVEELLGHAHNGRIDLHGTESNVGIVILKGSLRAASAKADHQDVGDLGLPKPGHVEVIDVFEVPFETVFQRHPSLHSGVEVKHPHSCIVHDADVMIRRSHLVNERAATARNALGRGGGCEGNDAQRENSKMEPANEPRPKRQRTAALQNLAEGVACNRSRQRLGVPLSSAAFVLT